MSRKAGPRGGPQGGRIDPFRVAVVGAGSATPAEASRAESLGGALADLGCAVITGGMGGVMAAASKGCRERGGVTVGLLPGTDAASGNPDLVLPLATGLGEARNALVVRGAEAVVAVGGEWGTLSEIALAKKMGRPVVVFGEPSFDVGIDALPDLDRILDWVQARMNTRRDRRNHEG